MPEPGDILRGSDRANSFAGGGFPIEQPQESTAVYQIPPLEDVIERLTFNPADLYVWRGHAQNMPEGPLRIDATLTTARQLTRNDTALVIFPPMFTDHTFIDGITSAMAGELKSMGGTELVNRIPTFVVSYPNVNIEPDLFKAQLLDNIGPADRPYSAFADAVATQLLNDTLDGTKRWEDIPRAEQQAEIRKVQQTLGSKVFVGYSMGTKTAEHFQNATRAQLQRRGFPEDVVENELMPQLKVDTYGEVSIQVTPEGRRPSGATTFRAVNGNDIIYTLLGKYGIAPPQEPVTSQGNGLIRTGERDTVFLTNVLRDHMEPVRFDRAANPETPPDNLVEISGQEYRYVSPDSPSSHSHAAYKKAVIPKPGTGSGQSLSYTPVTSAVIGNVLRHHWLHAETVANLPADAAVPLPLSPTEAAITPIPSLLHIGDPANDPVYQTLLRERYAEHLQQLIPEGDGIYSIREVLDGRALADVPAVARGQQLLEDLGWQRVTENGEYRLPLEKIAEIDLPLVRAALMNNGLEVHQDENNLTLRATHVPEYIRRHAQDVSVSADDGFVLDRIDDIPVPARLQTRDGSTDGLVIDEVPSTYPPAESLITGDTKKYGIAAVAGSNDASSSNPLRNAPPTYDGKHTVFKKFLVETLTSIHDGNVEVKIPENASLQPTAAIDFTTLSRSIGAMREAYPDNWLDVPLDPNGGTLRSLYKDIKVAQETQIAQVGTRHTDITPEMRAINSARTGVLNNIGTYNQLDLEQRQGKTNGSNRSGDSDIKPVNGTKDFGQLGSRGMDGRIHRQTGRMGGVNEPIELPQGLVNDMPAPQPGPLDRARYPQQTGPQQTSHFNTSVGEYVQYARALMRPTLNVTYDPDRKKMLKQLSQGRMDALEKRLEAADEKTARWAIDELDKIHKEAQSLPGQSAGLTRAFGEMASRLRNDFLDVKTNARKVLGVTEDASPEAIKKAIIIHMIEHPENAEIYRGAMVALKTEGQSEIIYKSIADIHKLQEPSEFEWRARRGDMYASADGKIHIVAESAEADKLRASYAALGIASDMVPVNDSTNSYHKNVELIIDRADIEKSGYFRTVPGNLPTAEQAHRQKAIGNFLGRENKAVMLPDGRMQLTVELHASPPSRNPFARIANWALTQLEPASMRRLSTPANLYPQDTPETFTASARAVLGDDAVIELSKQPRFSEERGKAVITIPAETAHIVGIVKGDTPSPVFVPVPAQRTRRPFQNPLGARGNDWKGHPTGRMGDTGRIELSQGLADGEQARPRDGRKLPIAQPQQGENPSQLQQAQDRHARVPSEKKADGDTDATHLSHPSLADALDALPPVAKDHIRVYRSEPNSDHVKRPAWIQDGIQDQEKRGMRPKGSGGWYTEKLFDAVDYYAYDQAGGNVKTVRIRYIDLPIETAATFWAPNRPDELQMFSSNLEHEFHLPQTITDRSQVVTEIPTIEINDKPQHERLKLRAAQEDTKNGIENIPESLKTTVAGNIAPRVNTGDIDAKHQAAQRPISSPETGGLKPPVSDKPLALAHTQAEAVAGKAYGIAGIASRSIALRDETANKADGVAVALDAADLLSDGRGAKQMGVGGNLVGVGADTWRGYEQNGWAGAAKEGGKSLARASASLHITTGRGITHTVAHEFKDIRQTATAAVNNVKNFKIAVIAPKVAAFAQQAKGALTVAKVFNRLGSLGKGTPKFALQAGAINAAATGISEIADYMTGKEINTNNVSGSVVITAVNFDPVKGLASTLGLAKHIGIDMHGIENASISKGVDLLMGGKGEEFGDILKEADAIREQEKTRWKAGEQDKSARRVDAADPDKPLMTDYKHLAAIREQIIQHIPGGNIDGKDVRSEFNQIDMTKEANAKIYKQAIDAALAKEKNFMAQNRATVRWLQYRPGWMGGDGGESGRKYDDAESQSNLLAAAQAEWKMHQDRVIAYQQKTAARQQAAPEKPVCQAAGVKGGKAMEVPSAPLTATNAALLAQHQQRG